MASERQGHSRIKSELNEYRAVLQRTGLQFPFERDKWYRLGDLQDFEEGLLDAVRKDKDLKKALRLPQVSPWVKLRANELIPFVVFAERRRLSRSTDFRIMPEGHHADIEFKADDRVVALQITTAGPVWPSNQRDWGYDNNLMLMKLNRGEIVCGFGPYYEDEGKICNRQEALSADEVRSAYRNGVIMALSRKIRHKVRDSELLVYVNGFEAFPESMFLEVVKGAVSTAFLCSFTKVHFVSGGHYYVEQSLDSSN